MKRRWLGVGLAITAALGVGWAFSTAQRAREQTDPESARRSGRPIPVRTAAVTETTLEDEILATAITAPSRSAAIEVGSARGLSGLGADLRATDLRLKAVLVTSGAAVERGQVLFELEDAALGQLSRRAEAQLRAAEVDVAYTHQKILTRQRRRQRDTQDTERRLRSAGPGAEQDRARARLEVLREEAADGESQDRFESVQADSRMEQARVAVELLRQEAARTKLKSPLQGFATNVDVVPAAEVQPTQVLTRVLQLDPLFVNADCPQERIDDIRVGQSARVSLDCAPQATFEGRIVHILPQANSQLRVVPVVVEMSNPGSRLKAGISGCVRFRVSRRVVLAPAAAVIQRQTRAIVFSVGQGRAHVREIQVGTGAKIGFVEVSRGLRAGDDVVIFNHDHLEDNDRVDVNWRGWAGRD